MSVMIFRAGFAGDRLPGPTSHWGYLPRIHTELRRRTVTRCGAADYISVMFQSWLWSTTFSSSISGILEQLFREYWIERDGPKTWLCFSPDLNSLDVYLWGYLLSMVYAAEVSDLQEEQQQIQNGFAFDETWSNPLSASTSVQACKIRFEPQIGHFENVL